MDDSRNSDAANIGPKSAEDCIEEATKIASGAVPPDIADRRRHERHAYAQRVQVRWIDKNRPSQPAETIETTDISMGGLQVYTRRMMHVGERGVAELPRAGSGKTVVGIEVANCRYVGEMRYCVGCRFVKLEARIGRSARTVATASESAKHRAA